MQNIHNDNHIIIITVMSIEISDKITYPVFLRNNLSKLSVPWTYTDKNNL